MKEVTPSGDTKPRLGTRHCKTCAVEFEGFRGDPCWSCGNPAENGRLHARNVTWNGSQSMTFIKRHT